MTSQVAAVIQVGIGVTLLWAAAAKVLSRSSLAPFLMALGLSVPKAVLAARAAPAVEGLVGFMLASGTIALLSATAAALLSIAFVAILVRAYRAGVEEPCHCFGLDAAERTSLVGIARSTIVAGASLVLVADYAAHNAITTTSIWRVSPSDGIAGTLVGITFTVLFLLLEQISSFERRRQALFQPRSANSGVDRSEHGTIPE